jgi:hypothetical protein
MKPGEITIGLERMRRGGWLQKGAAASGVIKVGENRAVWCEWNGCELGGVEEGLAHGLHKPEVR